MAFVDALKDRGAEKIYAASRTGESPFVDTPQITPIELDITDPVACQNAAEQCGDVDLLINNAGVTCIQEILPPGAMDAIRTAMEVNYFGPLNMCRAFALVLGNHNGGAIVNILSMAAMMCVPGAPAYSASKAAAEMLSHGVRQELGTQNTQVSLVYPGYVDTRMSDLFPVKKATPRLIADRTLNGVEANEIVIYPDLFSKMTRDRLMENTESIQTEPQQNVLALAEAFMQHPDAGS